MRPVALSLDLFGTIVFFDASRLPRLTIAGTERIVTMDDMGATLAEIVPAVSVDEFFSALDDAGREILQEKKASGREILTAERFRRTLVRLGVSDPQPGAERLAASHMRGLVDAVVCPPDRRELLVELSARYPLALTSNFDDAPTARELLTRFELNDIFKTVVVSAEVGFVKPAPEIFHATCAGLGAAPPECLHVGDSLEADIQGATAAGLASLWIAPRSSDDTNERIADIEELPAWLATRYG